MADLGAIGKVSKENGFGTLSSNRGVWVVPSKWNKRFKGVKSAGDTPPNVTILSKPRFGVISKFEAPWGVSWDTPLFYTDTSGVISGKVQQGGIDLANCDVSLFYRPTMSWVATTKSLFDGGFTFNNLLPGIDDYFIVAFDPEGSPVQNALIYDKIMSEGTHYDIHLPYTTTFLTHFNGLHDATSATDVGPYGINLTFSGNAKLSTASPKFGSASLILDGGASSYVEITDTSKLLSVNKTVTIEGWFKADAPAAGVDRALFGWQGLNSSGSTINMVLYVKGVGGRIFFFHSEYGDILPCNLYLYDNQYHHVVLLYYRSTLIIFFDGGVVGTVTSITLPFIFAPTVFRIGGSAGASRWNGYIDEFRIVRDVAVYPEVAFTPPTSELPLTFP